MTYARILMTLALVIFSFPAFAAKVCYTPDQAQAEQLLRLHSELMVITVTCRTGSKGEDLPSAYGNFTKKHIDVLHNAEQTMIAYYKANEKGNALDHLDKLRTLLGNEYGQKAADMTAPVFCEQYRDKVLHFDAASGAEVQNEAQHMQIVERSYAKPCVVTKTK